MSSYWEICVEEILGEHGIMLKHDQLKMIAKDMESASEMKSEGTGEIYIQNPLVQEIEQLSKKLNKDLKEKNDLITKAEQRMADKHQVNISRVTLTNDGTFEIRPR